MSELVLRPYRRWSWCWWEIWLFWWFLRMLDKNTNNTWASFVEANDGTSLLSARHCSHGGVLQTVVQALSLKLLVKHTHANMMELKTNSGPYTDTQEAALPSFQSFHSSDVWITDTITSRAAVERWAWHPDVKLMLYVAKSIWTTERSPLTSELNEICSCGNTMCIYWSTFL